MADSVFNIEFSISGRDGLACITIAQGQKVLAVETLNLLDSKVRDDYAHAFCADRAGIEEEEFRAELLRVADKIAKTKTKREQVTQVEHLVELAMKADLFHAPGGDEVYASMTVEAGHRETWLINSAGFRQWLTRVYYKTCGGKVPNTEVMQSALNVISASAVFDGNELPVFLRVAEHEGAIYLDLADESWHAVKIDSEGWQIVESENVPVRFIRKRGMLPILVPVSGGTIDELYRFVNLPDVDDQILFVGWLLAALRPSGPYPVLAVNGEQGSAKSTLCRFARKLIDPNAMNLRRPPKDERDLAVCAANSHILAFDNLSGLRTVFSDGLCALATGSGLGTRKLYSDGEEMLFFAKRPIVINGIEVVATRPDLMDRSVQLTLRQISPVNRKEESDLEPEFDEARPRILGALLNAVSCALRKYDETQLPEKPRMADFAHWVTAAESALGWERGTFMKAYLKNRASANELAIEASAVGPVIVGFVRKNGKWAGTIKDLLAALNDIAGARTKDEKNWPQNARALSGKLRRIAPNLRGVGIDLNWGGKSERGRVVSLENIGIIPSVPSVPSVSNRKSLQDNSLDPDGSPDGTPLFPDGPDGRPDGPDGRLTVGDVQQSAPNPIETKDLNGIPDGPDGIIPTPRQGPPKDEGVDGPSGGHDGIDGQIPTPGKGGLEDLSWVLRLSPEGLPPTPFVLNSTMKVKDSGLFLRSLQADLARGALGPRAVSGALQQQCEELRLLLDSDKLTE